MVGDYATDKNLGLQLEEENFELCTLFHIINKQIKLISLVIGIGSDIHKTIDCVTKAHCSVPTRCCAEARMIYQMCKIRNVFRCHVFDELFCLCFYYSCKMLVFLVCRFWAFRLILIRHPIIPYRFDVEIHCLGLIYTRFPRSYLSYSRFVWISKP